METSGAWTPGVAVAEGAEADADMLAKKGGVTTMQKETSDEICFGPGILSQIGQLINSRLKPKAQQMKDVRPKQQRNIICRNRGTTSVSAVVAAFVCGI